MGQEGLREESPYWLRVGGECQGGHTLAAHEAKPPESSRHPHRTAVVTLPWQYCCAFGSGAKEEGREKLCEGYVAVDGHLHPANVECDGHGLKKVGDSQTSFVSWETRDIQAV